MDFLDCHLEPIHIPGSIQCFGYLLGIDIQTKSIEFYSENLEELFPIDSSILRKNIFEIDFFRSILNFEYFKNINTKNANSLFFRTVEIKGTVYYVNCIAYEGKIYFEIEEKLTDMELVQSQIVGHLDSILYEDHINENEIWCNLADSIANIIDYDRVMVYQFLDDGSGKVIAEKNKDGQLSMLHYHYPEFDIPQQARQLYLKKKRRIFSDIDAPSVPIISIYPNIDLTPTELRSMSPIHQKYIKNSGYKSSLSLSIIVDDTLWGLVTCQNIKAKHVDYVLRVQMEINAIAAGRNFQIFDGKQSIIHLREFEKKIIDLRNELNNSIEYKDVIKNKFELIQNLANADGVAYCKKNAIITNGVTPTSDYIVKIIKWFESREIASKKYFNRSFYKDFNEELGIGKEACGILIITMDQTTNEYFIWFRKEFNEHIKWAGEPVKIKDSNAVNNQGQKVFSPRSSFEIFNQIIEGKSKIWTNSEIESAEKIVDLIYEISHKKLIEIKELNRQLKLVNDELNRFSYTISHDLGTPLTVMKLNAQMLEKMVEKSDVKKIEKLKSINNQIYNMESLMRDVLQLSKTKTSELMLSEINPTLLIKEICSQVLTAYQINHTKIDIANCPEVFGDATLVYQVFMNIISNAIKYSADKEFPIVKINGEDNGNRIIYTISDNGIGIPEDEASDTFTVFKRHTNAKKFKGNGVGMSIVYQIMKRLEGDVYFESKENVGTIFYLSFKRP